MSKAKCVHRVTFVTRGVIAGWPKCVGAPLVRTQVSRLMNPCTNHSGRFRERGIYSPLTSRSLRLPGVRNRSGPTGGGY